MRAVGRRARRIGRRERQVVHAACERVARRDTGRVPSRRREKRAFREAVRVVDELLVGSGAHLTREAAKTFAGTSTRAVAARSSVRAMHERIAGGETGVRGATIDGVAYPEPAR